MSDLKLTKSSIGRLLHLIGYDYIKLLKYDLGVLIQFQNTRNNKIVTVNWDNFVKFLKLKVSRYYIHKAELKFNKRYKYFNLFLSVDDEIHYICPEHGIIKQKYKLHYHSKVGCPECAKHSKKKVYNTESFIREANLVHNNKYLYTNTKYIDCYTKVVITCPIHGDFEQAPTNHLSGDGCVKCSKITFEDFLLKARKIHGDKYQYESCNNFKLVSKIKIICPKHGEFWQEARSHLNGAGCLKCSSRRNDNETFIEKALQIHGDKYDYSLVNYSHSHIPVEIICKKHGSFWQTPTNHLYGKGCPLCNESRGEKMLFNLFEKYFTNIIITRQKRFKWLGFLSLDFYFESYNIAVEFDGEQHFRSIEPFGGENAYKSVVKRDIIKNILCFRNNVKLFRVKYNYTTEDINSLINSIKCIITNNS